MDHLESSPADISILLAALHRVVQDSGPINPLLAVSRRGTPNSECLYGRHSLMAEGYFGTVKLLRERYLLPREVIRIPNSDAVAVPKMSVYAMAYHDGRCMQREMNPDNWTSLITIADTLEVTVCLSETEIVMDIRIPVQRLPQRLSQPNHEPARYSNYTGTDQPGHQYS